ncbi:MAG: co-chaperone GroES [Candidatus Omnitrophica bacterium]|jgi:chaperonin GroES|nr:co-chaperone GroES [Candidatus Omnitrophota bacterium]
MKLVPLFDRIVVKPDVMPDRTKAGLYIPQIAKEQPTTGEIIAVGEGKTENGALIKPKVSVGNRIYFMKYGGSEINVEGEEYLIMKEGDILAIVEEE